MPAGRLTIGMSEPQFDRTFEAVAGRVEQVSPLVRRVLCGNASPFTFTGTSSFIVGRGRVAIIDPGPDDPAHLAALLAAVNGESVSHILVTHSHADHSPLAARLQAATGAPILAQGSAAEAAAGQARLDAGIDRQFAPDRRLGHGERIEGAAWSLEAIFTPGHMSNHLCFALAEERTLFSGDHVMSWATSVIAPPEGNMADYLASLRLLLGRGEDIYLPAHGPARRDPLPYVRDLIAHRQKREAAILAAIAEGEATLNQIVARVYAGLDQRLLGAAALSARAHIDHLLAQGRIRETEGRFEPRPGTLR